MLYDDVYGSRDFTAEEKSRIERNEMPAIERIRIFNEPDPFAPPAAPLAPPIHMPATPPAPVIRPMPMPERRPPPLSLYDARVPNIEADYLKEKLDISAKEKKDLEAALSREKSARQMESLYRNDYDRIYRWGINLIPSYYTYLERKQIEDVLKKYILNQLHINTPHSKLEEYILKIINDSPFMESVKKELIKGGPSPKAHRVRRSSTRPTKSKRSSRSPKPKKPSRSPNTAKAAKAAKTAKKRASNSAKAAAKAAKKRGGAGEIILPKE